MPYNGHLALDLAVLQLFSLTFFVQGGHFPETET